MKNPITANNNSNNLYALVLDCLSACQSAAAKSSQADLPPSRELVARSMIASTLPIMATLDQLGSTTPETSSLVAEVLNSATNQEWRQPYLDEDFGSDFTARSGWFPIADREGPLVMTEGLVEIMLLDAGLQYPFHSHVPEELYLVLAGEVWWEADGDEDAPSWRKAGEAIHHPPNRRHSITAGKTPVLLLALWRGGGFEKPTIG